MAYSRIMIFGPPGGGKTSFALQLATALDLPLFHLDKIFFVKDWLERDHEEFLEMQKALVAQDKWMIDGNALTSLALRYVRADIAIYYAPSRWHCFWGILKRTYWDHRGHIDDRAPGCYERVTWGLLQYMWTFERRIRPCLNRLQQDYPQIELREIRGRRALADFLVSTLTH